MGRSEDQAARNESVFREANDRIAERRAELTAVEGKTPFLCECDDVACVDILRLSLEEYLRVRSQPTRFVVAEGHPTTGATVFAGRGWTCVEKTGGEAL